MMKALLGALIIAFAGMGLSIDSEAAPPRPRVKKREYRSGKAKPVRAARAQSQGAKPEPRIVYPERTDLDFEGARIEGELRNPGEFYFQYRPEEKFDSLVKRRKNFHREMLRDVVLSK